MKDKKKYFPWLFWDNPDMEALAKKLSLRDFGKYLNNLRTENPMIFDLILRRIIERGSLTEAFSLLEIEDIERGLAEFHIWNKIPEIRLHAWRHAIDFKREHERDAECQNL